MARTEAAHDGVAELSPEMLQLAAATFGLLASTMRLHMVWLLAQGEADVGTLAEATGGTLQTVSQHLAKLKLAGLVRSRREGRHQFYVADDPHIVTIVRQMVAHLNGAGTIELKHTHGLGA